MNGSTNAASVRYEPTTMMMRRTESSSRSCNAAAPFVTMRTTATAIARPMPLKMSDPQRTSEAVREEPQLQSE